MVHTVVRYVPADPSSRCLWSQLCITIFDHFLHESFVMIIELLIGLELPLQMLQTKGG